MWRGNAEGMVGSHGSSRSNHHFRKPFMSNTYGRHAVTHEEIVWIPVSDGVRLAARIWMPDSASQQPVPAILEYIPYRRRDGSRDNDDRTHPYLASHGYACVRLDIRGTGDSEGIILDEYLAQEQEDAVEAIAWIAAQPWCSGAVGMMGISWGGFNSLQVAARRPPALKAIVTLCSTDDRYADDMHYMGGSQLTGNLEWSSTFFSMMARAPDPLIVGDSWRVQWLQRLEAVTPMVTTALRHQRRDAYWQHGSVGEDIGAITCGVMAVGGWADGYSNAVFRLLESLQSPRLGIVGPWGHKWPHLGTPGPAIGFLTEMLRWWDYWLKDIDTAIMQEPQLRAYVQDWIAPASHYDSRPGRWVAEPAWPSAAINHSRLYLNGNGLNAAAGAHAFLSVRSPQTTGAASGEWCPYSLGGVGPELPTDQRADDAYSLVFDGDPLEEALDILGAPVLEITFSADRPVAQLIARLNDVAPDGQVARITYGVLNLTHRTSHADPQALEPGRAYTVRIALNDIGHRYAAGHRIRIALSTCYWPIVWPSPTVAVLTIHAGLSSLTLPVRNRPAPSPLVSFAPAEITRTLRRTALRTGSVHRTIAYDVASGMQRIEVLRDEGRSMIEDIAVQTGFHKVLRYSIHPDDPVSARAVADYEFVNCHEHGWSTTVRTRSAVSCTATEYIVEADLEAFEGQQRIFSRSWTERIARDLA
jgi:putative CocE/NonD family hydrolase